MSQTLSNIDWNMIASEIVSHAKFQVNKNIIEQKPRVYELNSLMIHFSNMAALIEKIHVNGPLHDSFFSNLRDTQDNHNALNYIKKGGIASIEQLNFIANLLIFGGEILSLYYFYGGLAIILKAL